MAAFIAVLPMAAKDRISRDVNDLPATAREMLSTYFGNQQVNQIKIDSHTFGGEDYEVMLSDGSEIDFNSKGEWTEVDCGRNAVPQKLVKSEMRDYVSTYYYGHKIVKIDKKRNGYEVELSNGVDLEFNSAGKFLRVDK